VAEAAVILHVKESWLERQAAARKIPFTMLGGSYRFTVAHLAEIVRINEKRPVIVSAPETAEGKARKSPASGTVTTLRARPRPDGPQRKRTGEVERWHGLRNAVTYGETRTAGHRIAGDLRFQRSG
jgi:excisionase family DNA binding protein